MSPVAERRFLEALERIASGIDELRTLTRAQAPSRVAVTVAEAQALLGCGRTRVFELLRDGRLERANGPGRSKMVTCASIESFLGVSREAPLRSRSSPRSSGPWRPVNRRRLGV